MKKLMKISDLVVDNNSFGTLDKWGLGYETLKEINPGIIMLSMPGYGNTGPLREAHLFGRHLEAMFGHSLLRGYRDLTPVDTPLVWQSDASGGQCLAFAALLALHYRSRTGKGQFIDLALGETMLPHLGEAIMDFNMNQRVQSTRGNRHPSAIQGTYRCKGEDNWVNITINNDEEWQAFCRIIGDPPWTKDKRFSDILSRYKNQDELDKLIEGWTAQYTHYEVMAILQKEGVPAGAVMSTADCYQDPHLAARGFFEEVWQADCGTHRYPGMAWKMPKTPSSIRKPAPLLGEHNEYVYKKILGFSDGEYDELMKEGHIGMEYPPSVLPRPSEAKM